MSWVNQKDLNCLHVAKLTISMEKLLLIIIKSNLVSKFCFTVQQLNVINVQKMNIYE